MKSWLTEIIDQIALGEFLAHSNVSCGQRFGLIAVDNAIEFMLVAYVEVYKQLVGGYKAGGIKKKEWDEKRNKFPELLAFVAGLEPKISPHEAEINRFHNFRNNLYHTGIPVTTKASMVTDYSKLARDVLGILFNIKLIDQEWDEELENVALSLTSDEVSTGIKRQVTYEMIDGLVKFTTSASPIALEAVALCLHGYSILTAAAPSRPLLLQSLARSGHPLSAEVIKARITDLKKRGWLQKNDLVLSSKGRKELSKNYML